MLIGKTHKPYKSICLDYFITQRLEKIDHSIFNSVPHNKS
jgi:hypothetical protein